MLTDHIEFSSDFIYFKKWTCSSPGKTVYLEKDNALPMTRDWYTPTASIFSQQVLYLLLFLVFYYIAFC